MIRKRSIRGIAFLVTALAVALPVTAVAATDATRGTSPLKVSATPPKKPTQAKAPSAITAKTRAALRALVIAARREGSFTLYSSLADDQGSRIAEAFEKKYGIRTQRIRAPGNTLLTRLSAEAAAGQRVADAVLLSDTPCQFRNEHPTWVRRFDATTVPLWPHYQKNAKQFLRRCAGGWTYPMVGMKPWGIIYNTNFVKTPPTWQDLLSSQYEGKVALPDARIADAYYPHWNLMLKTYGASYLTRFRANARLYSGGTPATSAVAAGESWIVAPAHIGSLATASAGGRAPIALSIPTPAAGLETTAFMLSPRLAPHPNAARLFLNYLLSAEGNLKLAGGSGKDSVGGYSIYYLKDLPRNYVAPNHEESLAAKERINELLGLK